MLLHLVGLAAAFGSLLAGLAAGGREPVFAPLVIAGLAVTGGSGLGLLLRSRRVLVRQRWLVAHVATAGAGAAAALALVSPASKAFPAAAPPCAALALVLLIATIASAVFKPRFGGGARASTNAPGDASPG